MDFNSSLFYDLLNPVPNALKLFPQSTYIFAFSLISFTFLNLIFFVKLA